jgi:hypothetical protein
MKVNRCGRPYPVGFGRSVGWYGAMSRYERNSSQLIGTKVALGLSSSSSAPGQPATGYKAAR